MGLPRPGGARLGGCGSRVPSRSTAMSSRAVLRCAIAAVLFGISAPLAAQLAADDIGAFTPRRAALPGRGDRRRAGARSGPTVEGDGASGGPSARRRRGRGRCGRPGAAGGWARSVSGATASLLLNLELVFTTILAAVVFHEHIGRRVAAGTALVLVAGVILAWSGDAALRWGAMLIAGGVLVLGDRQLRHGQPRRAGPGPHHVRQGCRRRGRQPDDRAGRGRRSAGVGRPCGRW